MLAVPPGGAICHPEARGVLDGSSGFSSCACRRPLRAHPSLFLFPSQGRGLSLGSLFCLLCT